eukprot:CAMPEP_0194335108 /NCGR_PEP_ID=MMETSP0171-20130528/68383_1 /TAXON_ID=218684 /ORGANISM="Corethron pennatum, Strain L29A3" /LENGTH=71 /DNA_ID=CAMNT_0039098035 /DNA_START=24 /DNA_END=236 /DNA_ORIENTATION=-
MAFHANCFEESSNLAIINANYKIPRDNPYGTQLEELLERLLTVDYGRRITIADVIMCLSCLFSEQPLPKRR